MKKYKIRSIQKYLPGAPITAAMLESKVGMPQGWIEKNAGVLTRYQAASDETVIDMATKALQASFEDSQLDMKDLDQLLFCSGSYDYPIPYNACLLKQAMNAEQATTPCFDIDATCLSFITGLEVALNMLDSSEKQRIGIVSSELSSRSLNPADFKTFSLFGDAAGATIIEKSEEGFSVIGRLFENYCEGADLALLPAGGAVQSGISGKVPTEQYYFQMQGKRLIKLTLAKLDHFLGKLEAKTGVAIQDYEHIVQHQTSKFGNDFFLKHYRLDHDKVYNGLTTYGNCISVSILLGLESIVNKQKIKPGDKVLLLGTAAGLSIGAIALQF